MVDGDPPQPKLADFGLARTLDLDQAATATGAVIGTATYMAPEQIETVPIDPRTDLYALGCLIHFLWAGAPPLPESDNQFQILRAHLEVVPPPLRARAPEAPLALEELTARLLAKDPAHRPQSAQEVVNIVAELLEGFDEIDSMPTVRTRGRAFIHRPPFVGRERERARLIRMDRGHAARWWSGAGGAVRRRRHRQEPADRPAARRSDDARGADPGRHRARAGRRAVRAVSRPRAAGGVPARRWPSTVRPRRGHGLVVRRRRPGDRLGDRGKLSLPISMAQVLRDRMALLAEPTQRVLRAAAIFGRRFDFAALRAVARMDEEPLLDALDEAFRSWIIRGIDGPPHLDLYEFDHARLVEVLLDDLSPSRRRAMHEAAARILEERPDTPATTLAHHFGHGEVTSKAVHYLLRAGLQALEVNDHAAAAVHLGEAWSRAETVGAVAADVRPQLAEQLADALVALGRPSEARPLLEVAPDGAVTPLERARRQRKLGRSLLLSGHAAEGLEAYRRALETLGDSVPRSRAAVYLRLVVDCSDTNGCMNGHVVCPDTMGCKVDCSGINSCMYGEVQDSATGPVYVSCSGTNACLYATVVCSGPDSCEVDCGGLSSCGYADITCGAGPCVTSCGGGSSGLYMNTDCSASCDGQDGC